MKLKKSLVAMCLFVLMVGSQAMAQTPDELIAIRNDYAKAMDDHDMDALLSFYTEDIVYDVVSTPPPGVGLDDLRAGWTERFDAFADFHGDEGIVLAAGNIVVVDHNAVGTFANGNTIHGPHFDIIEFEGDKIKKVTTYEDQAIQMIQLGFMSAPEMPPLVPSIEVPEPEAPGLSPLEANAYVIDLWNSHDAASIAKMYDSSARILIGPLATWLDRTQAMALNEMYFSGFSDVKTKVVRTVDMGDGWVLCEHVTFGTHDGSYMGLPASGYPSEIRVVWLIRYNSDGLIMEQTAHYDNLSVMTQLTTEPYSPAGTWISTAPTPAGNITFTHTVSPQEKPGVPYAGIMKQVNANPTTFGLFPEVEKVSDWVTQTVRTGRNTCLSTMLSYGTRKGASFVDETVTLNIVHVEWTLTGPDTNEGTSVLDTYLLSQDADGDGLPDEGQEPVESMPFTFTTRRLTIMPPHILPPPSDGQ
jgi:hypothetical protein